PQSDEINTTMSFVVQRQYMIVQKSQMLQVHCNLTFIGVGGVETAEQAYLKICAGAHLIQLYSAIAWHGPWHVRYILSQLALKLESEGKTLEQIRASRVDQISEGRFDG
ncbi:MAG: hypothetical protein AAF403_03770, partial [Pseudomonadota bacterium]